MANEKRLIDANAFISEYCENCGNGCDVNEENCAIVCDLRNAPTVDAVEVVHGRWIKTYKLDWFLGTETIDGYTCNNAQDISREIATTAPTAVQRWMVMGMREKLIKVLDVIGSCNAEYCCDCEFAEDIEGCVRRQKEIIADHLIANGVTIPVRCKDCMYYDACELTCELLFNPCATNVAWYPEDFCSYGERRTDE